MPNLYGMGGGYLILKMKEKEGLLCQGALGAEQNHLLVETIVHIAEPRWSDGKRGVVG